MSLASTPRISSTSSLSKQSHSRRLATTRILDARSINHHALWTCRQGTVYRDGFHVAVSTFGNSENEIPKFTFSPHGSSLDFRKKIIGYTLVFGLRKCLKFDVFWFINILFMSKRHSDSIIQLQKSWSAKTILVGSAKVKMLEWKMARTGMLHLRAKFGIYYIAVSYTHLTLPTKRIV